MARPPTYKRGREGAPTPEEIAEEAASRQPDPDAQSQLTNGIWFLEHNPRVEHYSFTLQQMRDLTHHMSDLEAESARLTAQLAEAEMLRKGAEYDVGLIQAELEDTTAQLHACEGQVCLIREALLQVIIMAESYVKEYGPTSGADEWLELQEARALLTNTAAAAHQHDARVAREARWGMREEAARLAEKWSVDAQSDCQYIAEAIRALPDDPPSGAKP